MAFKLPALELPTLFGKPRGKATGVTDDPRVSPLPLIGKLSVTKQFQILGSALLFFLLLAAAAVLWGNYLTDRDVYRLGKADDMRVLSQRLAKDVAAAATGDSAPFEALEFARKDFADTLKALDQGDEQASATTGKPREALTQLMAAWKSTLANLDQFDQGRPLLVTLQRASVGQRDLINLSGLNSADLVWMNARKPAHHFQQ